MKKVIRLTESNLKKIITNIVAESLMKEDVGEEPIVSKEPGNGMQLFQLGFQEGQTQISPEFATQIVNGIEAFIKAHPETIQAMEKFYKTNRIPKFITVDVGTSHTGSPEANARVAQGRLNSLYSLMTKVFGKFGISAEIIKQFMVNNTSSNYKPSSLDKNFYDPKKLKPDANERVGTLVIYPITIQGLNTTGIQGVQRGLNSASSIVNTVFVDGVDEKEVANYINQLQTYSDITDLSAALSAQGKWSNLEDFLNDQLFDDPKEMTEIAKHLKDISIKSGKQADTIRLYGSNHGYRISIGAYN